MLFSARSPHAAASAVGSCIVAGAILFGPAPLAQAAPPPSPAPPAGCTAQISRACTGLAGKAPDSVKPQPAAPGLGARGLAVRLPIRLARLPLRLSRLALRL